MYVAHAFDADGIVAFTRGGFTAPAEAMDAARTARTNLGLHGDGGWSVVEATMRQYAAWVLGDHSQPVRGVVRHSGGPHARHT